MEKNNIILQPMERAFPSCPASQQYAINIFDNPSFALNHTRSKLTASLLGHSSPYSSSSSSSSGRNKKHKLHRSPNHRSEKKSKTSSLDTTQLKNISQTDTINFFDKFEPITFERHSLQSTPQLINQSNFCSEDSLEDFLPDNHYEKDNSDILSPANSDYLANIRLILDIWQGKMDDVNPQTYLSHLLRSRGYDSSDISSTNLKLQQDGIFHTEKELLDYDSEIVNAVRTSNLVKLRKLYASGRSLTACNRFSESIIHMACRRADYPTVEFMVSHIPTVLVVDDYGRTPLHDACWRPEPLFDIVALLLERNVDLIRCKDRRGALPLHYVQKDHWPIWCAFLESQKEKYWAPINNGISFQRSRCDMNQSGHVQLVRNQASVQFER